MANMNLARIPEDWGDYSVFGRIKYNGDPQVIHLDPNMLHNGNPSIRVDGHQDGVDQNIYREVDGRGLSVKPGDRVVFKAWIKTGVRSGGNGLHPGGAIGFDLYGPSGRLWEIHPGGDYSKFEYDPAWQWQDGYEYVPYDRDWTLMILEFTVPDKVFTTQDNGAPVSPCQANAIIPLMGMYSNQDKLEKGPGWFADAELYINPAGQPSQAGLNVTGIAVLAFLGLGALYLWTKRRRKR